MRSPKSSKRRKSAATKKAVPAKNQRMTAYRQKMRAAGLRPVQLWLPDTRSPEFIAKCRRQAEAVAAQEGDEDELMQWVENVQEWPEWDDEASS